MSVTVTIHEGPLLAAEPWGANGAGAVICFEGMVRPVESGQPIAGLRYQTYDPMAENELRRLAYECVERFGILAAKVDHSRGFVLIHACSFRLRIASVHRKEGLAAMDWYIDQMKRIVPIWKRAVCVGESQEATR